MVFTLNTWQERASKDNLQIRCTAPISLIRNAFFGSIDHIMLGHFGRIRPCDVEKLTDQLLDSNFYGFGSQKSFTEGES
jgi:hypothetical protein